MWPLSVMPCRLFCRSLPVLGRMRLVLRCTLVCCCSCCWCWLLAGWFSYAAAVTAAFVMTSRGATGKVTGMKGTKVQRKERESETRFRVELSTTTAIRRKPFCGESRQMKCKASFCMLKEKWSAFKLRQCCKREVRPPLYTPTVRNDDDATSHWMVHNAAQQEME